MKLTDSRKSRIALFLAGILAGVLCRLSDFCPYESLWSFSSVATLFGFRIASISVITMHSVSHRGAFLNTFLYLFGMTISFYGLKYLLGFWVPCFDNGGVFLTKLFLLYSALSLLCGIGCSVLYCWNDRRWYSSVLLALPAGALLAEGIACGIVLFACRMLLAQTICGVVRHNFGQKSRKEICICHVSGYIHLASVFHCLLVRKHLKDCILQ